MFSRNASRGAIGRARAGASWSLNDMNEQAGRVVCMSKKVVSLEARLTLLNGVSEAGNFPFGSAMRLFRMRIGDLHVNHAESLLDCFCNSANRPPIRR